MAQPVNYSRAIDSLIASSSSNWAYTSWGEDNYGQNGFVALNVGLAPVTQTVGSSPWTFTNGNLSAVSMSVAGGTVSAISVSRNGQTAYASGLTVRMIDLKPGDPMTVTYSSVPTVTMIPRIGR